jgi:hypothetical protein
METLHTHEGQKVKLGRLRPKLLFRTRLLQFSCLRNNQLHLIPYLNAAYDQKLRTAQPAEKIDWTQHSSEEINQVYGNDEWGDCVIASAMHRIGLATGEESLKPEIGTTLEAITQYHQICGPGDPGCYIPEVLDEMQRDGITCNKNKHRITAYAALDTRDTVLLKTAIELFGLVNFGINLPSDWLTTDKPWGPTNSNIIGAHDVSAIGYDTNGVQITTWGAKTTILWKVFLTHKWVEECYVSLAGDWTKIDNLNPHGIDAFALEQALKMIEIGQTPPIPDPHPPSPIPPDPQKNLLWWLLLLANLACAEIHLIPPGPLQQIAALLCQLVPSSQRRRNDLTQI